MTKYKSVDWKKSPAHIEFLSRFNNPRSRKREAQTLYLSINLKEPVDQTIDRFIDFGMLVQPEIGRAIDALHNRGPLEEILRQHGLKTTGNKPQLIQRLVDFLPDVALSLVGNHDLLLLSEEARMFLDAYQKERATAVVATKERVFSALIEADDKAAYKTLLEFERKFDNSRAETSDYIGERVKTILLSNPKLLDGLNVRDKTHLRAATCMRLFWAEESASNWLPNDFVSRYSDGDIASNLLLKYAEIQQDAQRYGGEYEVQVQFDPYDFDSCQICRVFDGKTLKPTELPELPDKECTSEKGCQCRLRTVWDSHDYDPESEDESASDDEDDEATDLSQLIDVDKVRTIIASQVEAFIAEELAIRLEPHSKLLSLKAMLDEGLITSKEYETTKQKILSSF